MSVVRWLFILELMGLASWPLCASLFGCLPDGGFGLSWMVGAFLVSYAAWLPASVGIFPHDAASLTSFFIIYLLIAVAVSVKSRGMMAGFVRERKPILVFEQIFFLVLFMVAVFIQSYKPDITLAEKEPDMMFLQSVLKGRSMPPQDLWFCGSPVNYYYLGYVIFAGLISLSAVPPEIGFNLSVASVVPLACLGAFSLAYNLTRRRRIALLAPLFLLGLGNLDAFVRALSAGGIAGRDWFSEMFAHGSREVIPGTIHEFPCFSFLLGDLHPHFMFMPFSFLILSVILLVFKDWERIAPPRSGWVPFTLFLSVVLGSVFMFNTWDYPAYLFLVILAIALVGRARGEWGRWRVLAGWCVLIAALSVLFFLPFRLQFSPAARAEAGFVAAARRSPLGGFLTVNGLAIFVILSCLAAEIARMGKEGRPGGTRALLAGAVAAFIFGAAAGNITAAVTGGACVAVLSVLLSRAAPAPEKMYLLSLVFLCLLLFLGCEFFYLKDFYGERLQRQNTVFKYYFQAWILSSVIFSAGIFRVGGALRGAARIAWISVLSFLVAVSLIYPIWGTYHRCQKFRSGHPSPYIPTLDGAAYIRHLHPGEYAAISWVRENIKPGDVILEATGDPYSFFGRVSTFTGRPTLLGWGNQESLWRDWSWKLITGRTQDIARIYEELRKEAVADLMERYGIRYVYVGTLERKKYLKGGLDAFARSFPAEYRNNDVAIYKIK